jgi:hypothetical protein
MLPLQDLLLARLVLLAAFVKLGPLHRPYVLLVMRTMLLGSPSVSSVNRAGMLWLKAKKLVSLVLRERTRSTKAALAANLASPDPFHLALPLRVVTCAQPVLSPLLTRPFLVHCVLLVNTKGWVVKLPV